MRCCHSPCRTWGFHAAISQRFSPGRCPKSRWLTALLERFTLVLCEALAPLTASDGGPVLSGSLLQMADLEQKFGDLFLASEGMPQHREEP